MLISWPDLLRRQGIRPTGIAHVGGHLAEEARFYGQTPTWWIEPQADLVVKMRERLRGYRRHEVIQALVSDRVGESVFHLASNGQSSSMLPLGTHAEHHPSVTYTDEIVLPTTTLDRLAKKHRIRADTLVADCQGAEGLIVAGGRRFLRECRTAYLEINTEAVYEGCVEFDELNVMMRDLGFQLRELVMAGDCGWGDACWVAKR